MAGIRVTHWEARLRLLQMLPGLTMPAGRAEALRRLLAGGDYLEHANKLVRARIRAILKDAPWAACA